MTDEKKPNKNGTIRAISRQGDMTSEELMTEIALSPAAANASTALNFASGHFGELSLQKSFDLLREQGEQVQKGNMADAEAMLIAQATALNAMFNELARRAFLNMGTHLDVTDTYVKLSMKAQNQCRATLETLSKIKNPPVIFAKQANIANGPQQVNNGMEAEPPTRARQIETEQTQLLEQQHGERLDFGAATAASGNDPAMATVGEVHRPED